MRSAVLLVPLLWFVLGTTQDSSSPKINQCCKQGDVVFINSTAGEIKCDNQTKAKSRKCVDGEWEKESEMTSEENGKVKRIEWTERTVKVNETSETVRYIYTKNYYSMSSISTYIFS